MRTSIKAKHRLWRRIIFPFYSFHDVGLIAALAVAASLIMTAAGLDHIIPVALAGGYVGAVLLSAETNPAILTIDAPAEMMVYGLLKKNGYRLENGEWVPAFRKYRWPNDFLYVQYENDRLILSGPYDVLASIRDHLRNSDHHGGDADDISKNA